MSKLLDIFSGYKTYLLGVASLAYGIGGYFIGQVTQEVAVMSVLAGLGLITGRRAVNR